MLLGKREKRFLVSVSKIMRRKKTQLTHYRHSKKCNSFFCLWDTVLLFCLFVHSAAILWRTSELRWLFRIVQWGRGQAFKTTALADHWMWASPRQGRNSGWDSFLLLWTISSEGNEGLTLEGTVLPQDLLGLLWGLTEILYVKLLAFILCNIDSH